jgi:uncharacterized protein (DUF1015 family)
MHPRSPIVRPFPGLRPAPGRAAQVLAPPYDVVSAAEARQRVATRPWSFLHVSRPEVDLPDGTDPYSDTVYGQGAEAFRRMRADGVLRQDAVPCYYLYRLTMGSHEQTGLVAAASVSAYDDGRIRRHELTRPDKEDDRVRHIEALDAQTGPVFLTYRRQASLDAVVDAVTSGPSDVDVVADDGVRHTLWVIADSGRQEALTQALEGVERVYIADGHHRSAAASRVAAARRQRRGGRGEAPADYFLAVIFPDNQVQILAYHRVVRDLGGLDEPRFVQEVARRFDVASSPTPISPAGVGEIGLFLPSGWYRLRARVEDVPTEDPVRRLDVSLLAERLLAPLLGITDLRRDPRVDFVGGIRGLGELERRVRSGEMAAAFALHPTRLDDLMSVADADLMMPPKSTWFEPKLADGLVSHVLG